jgi:hypothetical protein
VLLLAYPAASPAGRAVRTLAADTSTGSRLTGLLADLLVTTLLAALLVLLGAAVVGRTRALTRPTEQ